MSYHGPGGVGCFGEANTDKRPLILLHLFDAAVTDVDHGCRQAGPHPHPPSERAVPVRVGGGSQASRPIPPRVPGRPTGRGDRRHPPAPPQPGCASPTSPPGEDFDLSFRPSIDPDLIADLASLGFVETGTPVLLLGRPGCGKSHLAIALGIRAVEAGYRGYFTTATDMVAAMTTAYADGTFTTKMRTYTGPSALVIDDVGITPFDRNQSNAFFQVVNRRYENRSATIVTTNRGLPAWADLFGGDSVVAAAILDRLLDHAAVINIKGGSWRLREHQALTQPLSQLNDPPDRPARRQS